MNHLHLNLKDANGDVTPLGRLVEEAADLGVVSPDIHAISELSLNSQQFVRHLRDQPAMKLFLLALRVHHAKLVKKAGDAVVDGESSNEEIRALLVEQKTIDTIIRYVNEIQGSFESGGGIK